MFELNIPQRSTPMTAYSQVDLSPRRLFWLKASGSIPIYGPYIQPADNTHIVHHTLTIGTSIRKGFVVQLLLRPLVSNYLAVSIRQQSLPIGYRWTFHKV